MRTLRARLLMWAALLGAGSGWAKEPSTFREESELSEEERQRAKGVESSGLRSFEHGISQESPPFPWMAVGLAGLAFVAVAPLAYRAFRTTSAELESGRGKEE